MKKQSRFKIVDGEKAVSLSTVIYFILILLVVVIATGSILAYGTETKIGQKIAAQISKVVPFPAAIIDWKHVIYIDDIEKNLSSVQQFYKSQNLSVNGVKFDFESEAGQKKMQIKEREILDKLVEDQIIEILAKNRGISVSQADVDQAVNAKLNEFGTSNDVKKDLLKSFGWTIEDFKNKVVLPSMYADALAKSVNSQQLNNDQAKSKIQTAQNALLSGSDFAQVSSQFSDGASKASGGKLGWVSKNQVLPELADALFGGAQLQKDAIIESSIGFHIVEIENKKKENDGDVLQLRQIFVAKQTFADWLTNQKKQMRVAIPMKEFTWNEATGSVEFSDPAMNEYEKNERANAKGDEALLL